MTEKLEGTIVLDGLIEGRLSGDPNVEVNLQRWIEFVATLGLRFSLDAGGAAFSVLPDNHAQSVEGLGNDPEDAIRQALQQLVEVLPAGDRGSVFSTLRSSEYRKNEEVQTLYVVGPDQKVQVKSRSVEAKTVAPPQPISKRERVKLAIMGLLIAVVIIGIAMLFPPVREKFSDLVSNVKPVKTDEIVIQAGPFSDHFTIKAKEFTQGGRVLVLEVKREAGYPKDDAGLQAAYDKADTLRKKMAVEAIARGYVRIELSDDEGKLYSTGEFRIRELGEKEVIEVSVPVTAGDKRRRLDRVDVRP